MSNNFNGWVRPTLQETEDRVFADLENALPGQNANLRYTPLNALGAAVVGQSYEQNGYIEWSARQCTVLYCDDENLDIHGAIWGVPRQFPTYASGFITITGVPGTTLTAGAVFQSAGGLQFVTTTDATLFANNINVTVTALDIGVSANLTPGTTLTSVSTTAGIDSTATVYALAGGTDIETADSYRSRILTRIQTPPQGGCAYDYITWAKTIPGVTRAWVYPLENGNGTVVVRFMMDDVYPVQAGSTTPGTNGIPTFLDIYNVAHYIEQVKPVTAMVSTLAPTPIPYDITIDGLISNDSTTRQNIINEITNAIIRDGVPGGKIYISRIWAAISLATGETSFTATTPNTDTQYNLGEIPVVGTVTFTGG